MDTDAKHSPSWAGCHLLISWPCPEQKWLVNRLETKLGLKVTWLNAFMKVEDPSIYLDVDIIATMIALPDSREMCPRLKYCHTLTAGIDYVAQHPLSSDPTIRWTYSSGIHGPVMAEWVFMTYLAFEKQNEAYREAQRRRSWKLDFKAMQTRDLVGQRVGILGYGSIGRQIAKVASAFSMEVVAFTATSKETPEARKESKGYRVPGTGDPNGEIPVEWFSGTDKASLHRFLAQKLDLLVLACPGTPRSRGLIGKEELAILASHSHDPAVGAFVTNVARGEVIVQDDLIAALKTEGSGIRGAALDVQTPEPLPPDSPLWDAPNVFITPHNCSQSNRYMERGLTILMENLQKPWDAEWINEVDFKKGY